MVALSFCCLLGLGCPKQAFAKIATPRSHGCIRVENPNKLAQFVLRKQPEWDAQKIQEAMQAEKPSIVDVAQKIPVLIFYSTALVTQAGLAFYPDIYNHDSTLKSSLAQRSELFTTLHTSMVAAF